jgi:hypothetical protein
MRSDSRQMVMAISKGLCGLNVTHGIGTLGRVWAVDHRSDLTALGELDQSFERVSGLRSHIVIR